MYQKVGQVSPVTISQLQVILSNANWEVHVSNVTDHQAASCTEQVSEIAKRWPGCRTTLMRLPPKGKLYRHHDEGWGYVIPIETNWRATCSTFEDGVETNQHLKLGNIYKVDRSLEHESFNNGRTNRTHLIIIPREQSHV